MVPQIAGTYAGAFCTYTCIKYCSSEHTAADNTTVELSIHPQPNHIAALEPQTVSTSELRPPQNKTPLLTQLL